LYSDIPILHECSDAKKFDIVLTASAPFDGDTVNSSLSCDQRKHTRIYDNDFAGSKKILCLSAPYLKFKGLMANITDNVSILELGLDHVFDMWVNECKGSNNLLHEFEDKLLSIDNLKIPINNTPSSFYNNTKTVKLERELSQITAKERIDAFQSFVNGVSRNRNNLLCDMTLNLYYGDDENNNERDFEITIQEGAMRARDRYDMKGHANDAANMALPLSNVYLYYDNRVILQNTFLL
jgi:hypothetical protein